jgi:hypothetical protein
VTVQIKVEHVSVSSTLPRTTRSRWFLIRSSSIVMRHDGDYTESAEQCHRLFLFLAWLRFSHLQVSQIRGRQPLPICAKDFVRHQFIAYASAPEAIGALFTNSFWRLLRR